MAVAVAESQRDQQIQHVKRLILEKTQLTRTLQETVKKMVQEPTEGSSDLKSQPRLYALHHRMVQLFDRVSKVDEMMSNVEAYRNGHVQRSRKLGKDVEALEKKLEEVKSMKGKPSNGVVQQKKRLDFYSSYLQYALKPLS